ncbi:MAG TPA: spermidine/putrescine ABC transporter substrate-binding protein [Thermoplasmata archaeon]
MASETPPGKPFDASRRRFLRLGLGALGIAGVAALGGGLLNGIIRYGTRGGLRSYEISPGVVDYEKVPEGVFTSNELRLAQWYDYWPGSFIVAFKNHIKQVYNRDIDVRTQIYTSNEELFTWVTASGRRFDVMFPTNYMAQIMDRAGLLYNMNEAWLPNLVNLDDGQPLGDFRTPLGTPYAFRPDGSRMAVPYQWGTTGIGYNTTVFSEADMEGLGWDVFRRPSWNGYTLQNRMLMLDDMREVLGAGMKMAGWDEQLNLGYVPTSIPRNPNPPYNGMYQWTENETSPERIGEVEQMLLGEVRPNLLQFNTQNQGPYLVQETTYANHAWSGDIMYAVQPYSNSNYPVNYLVPKQGGARWIDNAVIHRESRNLWLAHEFIDFFLTCDQGAAITDWNLYATPNDCAYETLTVYPNGYDPRQDTRIYPTAGDLARCDYQEDVGVQVTQDLLIPAWNRIKFA